MQILRNAKFSYISFNHCNLSNAHFNQANISYCQFENNDLSHATTGQIRIQDHTNYVYSITFSIDNKYLVTGSVHKSIIIYDVNNNFNKINQIQDHTDSVISVSFSNDNKYWE